MDHDDNDFFDWLDIIDSHFSKGDDHASSDETLVIDGIKYRENDLWASCGYDNRQDYLQRTAAAEGIDTLLSCAICSEKTFQGGEHQICTLPCGHIFGLAYIRGYLDLEGKCEQCNAPHANIDVIKLNVAAKHIGVKYAQKDTNKADLGQSSNKTKNDEPRESKNEKVSDEPAECSNKNKDQGPGESKI